MKPSTSIIKIGHFPLEKYTVLDINLNFDIVLYNQAMKSMNFNKTALTKTPPIAA